MPVFTGTERYDLLRTLGQGGMGTVYAVFDRRRQRKLALKVLSDPDAGSLFRFKREFRAVADLRHPHLVRLYDLGVLPEGGFFFTMELVEGKDLAGWVRQTPQEIGATVKALADTIDESITQTWAAPPTPTNGNGRATDQDIARVLTGVVSGLDHLHQTRKVHRDLKPSNVMVDGEGRARLLDFGILRELDRAGLTGEAAVGTPLYMAPEQVTGDEVTPASDLYSLGCMLYQLITGTPPFTGKPTTVLMSHVRDRPQAPSAVGPCDPGLEQLCLALLEKLPDRRPTSAEALERLWGIAGCERPADETGALAPVRVPEFLGRQRELAALEQAWRDAHDGPRVVLIAGESGSGKSALAAEFADRMQDRVRPWFGGCYEREHVPYKAFDAIVDAVAVELTQRGDDVFRLLPAGSQALSRLFPVLREVPAILTLDPDSTLRDPRAERQRAGRAFFGLLSNLSDGAPPLLIIDDLQRSDVESLDVIKWIPRMTDPPNCLIVGTYRSEEVDAQHPLLEVLEGTDRVTQLELPPLDRAASDQLAQACATSPLSETQLQRLAEDAQGNPFLVVELARAAGELDAEALPSVTELVRNRLSPLGDESRQVLEAAAVGGGRVSFDMLVACANMEPARVAGAVDELLRVLLLREVQGHHGEDAYDLVHDRLRQAIYEGVEPERRTGLHRLLAEELGRVDDAARAVEHWRLAGDTVQAREAALAAATAAEGQLAFNRAAELYALAARDGESWTLQVSLARALAKAGRHSQAAEAFERAAESAPAESARDLSLDACTEHMAAGAFAAGMSGLDALLRPLGTTVQRSFLGSWISLAWRGLFLMIAWFLGDLAQRFAPWLRRGGRTEPDPETAYKLRVFETAHQCLVVARPIEAARFGVRAALLARRYCDPKYEGRARIGYSLFLAGDLGAIAARRAYHHVEIGEALCAEVEDREGLLRALMTRSFIYLLLGNWEGIRRSMAQAESLARKGGLFGNPTLTSLEAMHLASEVFRGDQDQLVVSAERYLSSARARGHTIGMAWPMCMLGFTLLYRGEDERGRALLEEALEITPAEPLTVLRVYVELQSLMIHLHDRDAEAGLTKLADLDRRWRESGLYASALEDATYRLLLARFRLLKARQGGGLDRCHLYDGVRQFLPVPSSIKDEMLRLEAAVAFMNGRLLRAARKLDRCVYAAERRGNRFSLGLTYVARARVREALKEPGAAYDRQRGEEILTEIGSPDCFLLQVEGWQDEPPARLCSR